jgi:hypothetical protein
MIRHVQLEETIKESRKFASTNASRWYTPRIVSRKPFELAELPAALAVDLDERVPHVIKE